MRIAILLLTKPDLFQLIPLGFSSGLLELEVLVVANDIVDVCLIGVFMRFLGNPVIFQHPGLQPFDALPQVLERLSARARCARPGLEPS